MQFKPEFKQAITYEDEKGVIHTGFTAGITIDELLNRMKQKGYTLLTIGEKEPNN